MQQGGDPPTRRLIFATTLGLWIGAAWLATQRGLWPRQPQAMVSAAYLVIDGLLVLGPLWAAAAGWGYLVRRAAFDRMPMAGVVQVGTGLALLMLAGWCWAAWAGPTPWGAWALAAPGWGLLLGQAILTMRNRSSTRAWPLQWTWALPGLPLGLMLVAACCPPGTLWAVEAFGYDVMTYHLQLPREWLESGRLTGLTHNVYSFLPGLVESAYLWLGGVRGSVLEATYLCQLFHVSMALYAAVAVGCGVSRATGAMAGGAACAVALALPWSVVTGSMAYNEMAVLAFAATAVLVVSDPVSERWAGAAAVGLLVGAAVFAKPTAGFMVALPLGVWVWTGLNQVLPWRSPPRLARRIGLACLVLAVAAVLQWPWMVRNAAATGNPLFPFACELLGRGHWDQAQVRRWQSAHGLRGDASLGQRGRAVLDQWLFHAGYGALGGSSQTRQATRMAVFDRGPGFPLLWTFAAVGGVLSLRPRQTRGLTLAMTLMLAIQLAAWTVLTHLQSRFLMPTLIPAATLAGLGLGRLEDLFVQRRWWLTPSLTVFLVVSLTASSFNEFFAQVRPGLDPWDIVDSLDRGVASHPLDDLPPGSRVLLVGDVGGLLYIDTPVVYATAFDRFDWAVLDRPGEGAAPILTHVWVGWSELQRLNATYGYDVSVEEVRARAGSWKPVQDFGHATLYAVPR